MSIFTRKSEFTDLTYVRFRNYSDATHYINFWEIEDKDIQKLDRNKDGTVELMFRNKVSALENEYYTLDD